MVNKIIWKVILMIGGIVGTIFSIVKIPEINSRIEEIEYDIYLSKVNYTSYDTTQYYEEKLEAAQGNLYFWIFLLIVFIILFFVGCCMSTNETTSNDGDTTSPSDKE